MSVREKPIANRYLAQIEQEEAYKKHTQALANARPTVNTSKPVSSSRIRMMKVRNAENRKRIIQQNEVKERMLSKAQKGKKSTTIAKGEKVSYSSRTKQNVYEDIDLFAIDKTNYKSSTSRIKPQHEAYLQDYDDTDDIPYPSDDDDDDDIDNLSIGNSTANAISDDLDFRVDPQSESIRIGYGDKLVDSFTESTSIINSSEEKKKKDYSYSTTGATSARRNKTNTTKTFTTTYSTDKPQTTKPKSSATSSKIPKVAKKPIAGATDASLTSSTHEESPEPKKPSDLLSVVKKESPIASGDDKKHVSDSKPKKSSEAKKPEEIETPEPKKEEKPEFSLKKFITDKIEQVDKPKEEEKPKVEANDDFSDLEDDFDTKKDETKVEEVKSTDKENEENLFSSDDPDTISEKSPAKPKIEEPEKPKEEKPKDEDENFEDSDLDLPDF